MTTQYNQIDHTGKITASAEVDLSTGQVNPSEGSPGLEFEVISDDLYGSVKEFDTGEMKYRLIIEIVENPDSKDEYLGILSVVKSPKYLPTKIRKSVAETSCVEVKNLTYTDLYYYGLNATVASNKGNDPSKLLDELSKQAPAITGLLGFFLDKPQNAVGATGWDLLIGNIMGKLGK